MKKILSVFLLALFLSVELILPQQSFAQNPAPQAQAPAPNAVPTGGLWVVDPEVTFIGKNAARSGALLDWTLQNYNWVCVKQVTTRQVGGTVGISCDDSDNPIAKFWGQIVVFIVVPLLFFIILVTAAVIIITRGRSLTIMRFIPRFIAVILLVVFSYSILQFLYQFTDLIQGFFLRSGNTTCPPACISQNDLLYVGWQYPSFIGLRLLGDYNAESAFISLLLTKLTALTYFVMVGILLIRKIILWFFIIVSPIFPLLLLYYPTRNTGKIWIGEFFRWLLYAPLFAIFLKGLVFMWRQQIPLVFNNPDIGNASKIVYPTAVNILLGGPRQFVTPTNSVNLTETFALYVVALIMLWIVILLPWILLQIFLDYAANFAPGDSAVMKTLVNLATTNKTPIAPAGGSSPPDKGGAEINLPFAKRFTNMPLGPQPTGAAKEIIRESTAASSKFAQPIYLPTAQVKAQVANLANVALPSMRDIAKYETAMLSTDTSRQKEVTLARESLEKIANPVAVTSTVERDKYVEIHDRLVKESQQGNTLATSILSAASSVSKRNIQASNQEIKSVLQQIANPASSTVNRDKMTQLHDQLTKESKQNNNELASKLLSVNDRTSDSEVEKIKERLTEAVQQGNMMASSVVSTVNTTSQQTQTANQLKSVLKQIANPASVTNTVDREKFSKLHDALQKESRDSNNQIATSILQVSDSTSIKELEKIKGQLMQSKDNTVLISVNTAVQQAQATTKVKSVLQQVSNPATATSTDRERLTKIKDSLTKASQRGNELATSILGVTDKTSTAEIEKLQERIMQAKQKGEPIATEIASMTQKTAALPMINRVQTVNQADYQAVRDMWKENYKNLEVPQGMAGSRSEWIKDDIGKIDEIVGLLTSSDQEKVTQGVEEVSAILPFLLVGGFSQTEIIAYLKAKQEAAKEVIQTLAQEEEDKVSIQAKTTTAANQQTMAATIEEPEPSSASNVSSEESPLVIKQVQTVSTAPRVSNEILSLVNLKAPRMQDVARYETSLLAGDKTKIAEVVNIKEILEKIANPAPLAVGADREKYEKLRDHLVDESQKGNTTADAVLAAATRLTKEADEISITLSQIKTTLNQIAHPESSSDADKDFFTRMHEYLEKESKENNNALATRVLSVTDQTPVSEIDAMKGDILKEHKEKSPIADKVMEALNRLTNLPDANRVQQVTDEDYEEVKKMWRENYKTLPVPPAFGIDGRNEWIQADVKDIEATIALLQSPEPEKKNEGIKKVSAILPFLLLGGFSLQEMIGYLKAKHEAAQLAFDDLQKEEAQKVTVDATKPKEEQQKTLAVDNEKKS